MYRWSTVQHSPSLHLVSSCSCQADNMSHRSRSRTVDSVDSKKPRRLTEKIAIMKKREHEQLEEFEHAMQSIHEVGGWRWVADVT